MNYYDAIKEELVNNEIYKKVKDYSKNRSDLNAYYNVGKLLADAGKHYGESIIKKYSIKLTKELGKGYSTRTLKYMRSFYLFQKGQPPVANLSWSHYTILLSIKDSNEINYYMRLCLKYNLSKRELIKKIKSKEYERLDEKTKNKLIDQEELVINDFIKNPIMIKNKYNYEEISEKMLKKLILEDLSNFMKELGEGFTFVDSEYKIKLGDRYNYIDILLYNINFNCYVVVELKITELKKEHIGQMQTYMNYIDKNIKQNTQNKTIGVIIVKKDNKFVMEYCSDERVFRTTYFLSKCN